MTIFNWIVTGAWAVFILYWAISMRGIKKDIGGANAWRRSALARIVIIVCVFAGVYFLDSRQWFGLSYNENTGIAAQSIGAILCCAGIALAIWARRNLGTNWSGAPSVKEGHELVTFGPYRFVRHPIYTGIIAAFLGSALVGGPTWLILFLIMGGMFIWRIRIEEGFMMQLFPGQYPEYKKRTKALIPFIW